MISCKKLGSMGRLGNQMFQYAFLRSSALRLRTTFFVPPWVGDDIFELNDKGLREAAAQPLAKTFVEAADNCGFQDGAVRIEDGTEVSGYFQSADYFIDADVRSWFRFRPSLVARRVALVPALEKTVAVHIRFGDFLEVKSTYYQPRPRFYRRARATLGESWDFLIFSDEVERAKRYLEPVFPGARYVVPGNAGEDLALMAGCRHFIGSPSTFFWWGAWLGGFADKKVFVPREGSTRPGAKLAAAKFWPAAWTRLAALYWFDRAEVVGAADLARRVASRVLR